MEKAHLQLGWQYKVVDAHTCIQAGQPYEVGDSVDAIYTGTSNSVGEPIFVLYNSQAVGIPVEKIGGGEPLAQALDNLLLDMNSLDVYDPDWSRKYLTLVNTYNLVFSFYDDFCGKTVDEKDIIKGSRKLYTAISCAEMMKTMRAYSPILKRDKFEITLDFSKTTWSRTDHD